MKTENRKLTLDQPAAYEIKVPGNLDDSWSDWADGLTITVDDKYENEIVSSIIGSFDQATLHGLLRRLYGIGLPLISVNWIEHD
jgi:hypothetical protein